MPFPKTDRAYCPHDKRPMDLALFSKLAVEAPGAWINGTHVVHQDGTLGVILGSIGPAPYRGKMTYGYFVRFEEDPFPSACRQEELVRAPDA